MRSSVKSLPSAPGLAQYDQAFYHDPLGGSGVVSRVCFPMSGYVCLFNMNVESLTPDILDYASFL